MGARFRVLVVGRSKVPWAQGAVDDYGKRLRRHGGVEEKVVKSETFRGDVDAVRAAEGTRLLRAAKGSRLVVLDERGDRLDSERFAALVDTGRQAGPLSFALGGAYGHAPEVRAEAWKVVRLSDLVLNHEVARVVLYEQLYRAMTLLTNSPYHH